MRRLLLLLAALLPALPAAAQREVYDPEPPRGSAYLRFVNATDGEVEVRPDFAPAQRLPAEAARRVGAYAVVENVAGRRLSVEVRAGGRSATATVAPPADGFMTVLVMPGPGGAPVISPVTEEMNFNRARARIGFYNAVPGCEGGGLRLHPDGPAVFEGVAPGAARNRSVNPVNAEVAAGCGGRTAPVLRLEGLEAGQSHSLFLVAERGALRGLLARDVTTPWRR